VPFASGNALFGLSKLSVRWLRLGISVQRIKPGHPERNGRHERMHLTLKTEATKPAAFNFLQQQERFDDFVKVYNNEQPHQALGGTYPGDIYTPSTRVFEPPPEPEYPYHDRSVRVTRCGRICLGRRKINLSTLFAGQMVGIREIEEQIWNDHRLVATKFSDRGLTILGREDVVTLETPFKLTQETGVILDDQQFATLFAHKG
jgi:hypothetical protein